MTNQEVFDKVATHLLTQNKKSIDEEETGNACKYRGPNGLKCAAGILIPDDVYAPCMENVVIATLLREIPELAHLLPFASLLFDLQQIHDWEEVKNWKTKLQELAVSHNLSTSRLKSLY